MCPCCGCITSEISSIANNQTLELQSYASVNMAGKVFTVDSGIKFTQDGNFEMPFVIAYITELLRIDNNDLMWLAVVTPVRDHSYGQYGVSSGISPTHDPDALPSLHVWLTTEDNLSAVNLPLCNDGRLPSRVWIIEQN